MIQYEHPSPQEGDEDRYEPADALCDVCGRRPGEVAQDGEWIAAVEAMDYAEDLARSHEQLRSELRQAEIATYDALAMLGEARAERDADSEELVRSGVEMRRAADEILALRASARAVGCAADALREIVEHIEENHEHLTMGAVTKNPLAEQSLAWIYYRAVSGQPAEKEEAWGQSVSVRRPGNHLSWRDSPGGVRD